MPASIAPRRSCRGARRRTCTRISPVEASTRYLRHMVEAWNYAMAASDPEHRAGKAAGGADGAGVVRRHGPHPHGRGRRKAGLRKPDAAGRAAGRLLLLAGDAFRRRGARQIKPGDHVPGRGRRRRHQRLQPDSGRRAAGRAGISSARRSAITCCWAATTWTWRWPSSWRPSSPLPAGSMPPSTAC